MKAINVKDYGAKGDVKTVFSRGSMDAGSDIVRLSGGGFNQFDKKKKICISRVGAVNIKTLRTAIKDYKNSEEVILESKSVNSGSGLTVTWGTDDTVSVQEAVAIAEIGDTIIFPPAIYCLDKVRLKSGISFGPQDGSARPIITQIPDNTALFMDPVPKPGIKPIKGVTFQGLVFDGSFDLDEKNLQGEIIDLANINGHSDLKFLNCEARNFGKGLYVRGKGHSLFEIRNSTFTKMVNPIYFLNSVTTNIKITDCKFVDCYDSVTVLNNSEEFMYNTCDIVLIENCTFSGNMNYPIHFGAFVKEATQAEGRKVGIGATHGTVKKCEVVGPDRWWWQVPKGSADQIALYNVEHFIVIDNRSTNGGTN